MYSLASVTVLAVESGAGNGALSFLPLLLIVAVFYLLLIRPQQRKAKAHQALVQSIGIGDRVITIGGLHATVESIDEDTARLELAPGTTVTITRGAIARRLVDADESAGEAADSGGSDLT